jgi:transcriptional regulator with XRE-family HTH domain
MDEQKLPPYQALREATGLTQRAVERQLEWKTGRLSVIERGLIPTTDERQALLRFYNAWLTKQLASDG